MHVGIANPRWRGKRSRHSRRMRNPQFYISGKRTMATDHCSQTASRPLTRVSHKRCQQRDIVKSLNHNYFSRQSLTGFMITVHFNDSFLILIDFADEAFVWLWLQYVWVDLVLSWGISHFQFQFVARSIKHIGLISIFRVIVPLHTILILRDMPLHTQFMSSE